MTPTLIHIEALHRSYALDNTVVHALRGIDLAVAKGEVVFLAGPSGSGKSTLLHLIGGLDRPSQGSVTVAGKRLDQTTDDELSRFRAAQAGFIFQSFNLLPVLTVAENVEYPLLLTGHTDRRPRVRELLRAVGLEPFARHYPNQLSGGQRQRVAIARALVNQPSLLIADEPTANLDSETGDQVMQLMLSLSREHGSTLVICCHNPALLDTAQRVVTLTDGKVVSDAPGARHLRAGAAARAAHRLEAVR
jgi:putative ABC transport system ATP-binding protein